MYNLHPVTEGKSPPPSHVARSRVLRWPRVCRVWWPLSGCGPAGRSGQRSATAAPRECARPDSGAGQQRWAPASARPRVQLERSSDEMGSAKSKSLAFIGVLLSCLEMVSATYLLQSYF